MKPFATLPYPEGVEVIQKF